MWELVMDQEEMLDDLANRIQQMQIKAQENAQKRDRSLPLKRGFHAKGTGVQAKFKVRSDIPKHLHVGLFQPNAEYEALVRFSNARGEVLGDLAKDQRGAAFRVKTLQGAALTPNDYSDIQDFLMTNTPISFARNPVQFIEVGEILLGGIDKVAPRLIKKYGFKEAQRILGVFLAPIISFKPLQMNQYWSRTSYKYGDYSIRYSIRPSVGSKTLSSTQQLLEVLRAIFRGAAHKENYLREKLLEELKQNDLRFDFCVQQFVDDRKTPIEDAYIEWKESDSPPILIATLTIPKQNFDQQLQVDMEQMAFNPWHTKDFKPLGLINLARMKVYDASARNRGSSLQPYR
jgi:catalase